MRLGRFVRDRLLTDTGMLIGLGLAVLVLHILTNGQYGFHRDELATLDDARYLAWGYIAYPPLTPFIGRVALTLFGPSMVGVRFFSALAECAAIVLAGLMAREMGGRRWAQLAAALAVAIIPNALIQGALFMYVSFDYLWWVLLAYLVIRLLKSENPRWWLGIGLVIGLGVLTKYTIAYFVVGVVGAVLLTSARRYLRGPWLWAGAGLALLVASPNLIWQAQHGFISLEYLMIIHTRDIGLGRTSSFFIDQFVACANIFTLPLWLAGLYMYFFTATGKRYRMIGWMYVIPIALLIISQGRGYYATPVYPMLLAGGAVFAEQWMATLTPKRAQLVQATTWGVMALSGLLVGAVLLPIAPINSGLWKLDSQFHDDYEEELGWQGLTHTVDQIYQALPASERAHTAILAGNYGEAGAIDLYGPAQGLPNVISAINSYWARGYGDPAPETLILLGFSQSGAQNYFQSCQAAGTFPNPYHVKNEETTRWSTIYVCRGPRLPWPEMWQAMRHFG